MKDLISWCKIYLGCQDPVSRKAEADQALRMMYEILKRHFEPVVPDLGVSVVETVRSDDKVGE